MGMEGRGPARWGAPRWDVAWARCQGGDVLGRLEGSGDQSAAGQLEGDQVDMSGWAVMMGKVGSCSSAGGAATGVPSRLA